ncbi:hypothetical protein I302_100939 [Kwoniella bestiolae CBS 10118]|uniref:Esterase n=1 Tax=Kwoniella bestiolae CBS 10118 TaxID=1296100 RepID=A0A1B9G6G8_9TREE|nr:esterase [Kwoniella bestiolae CBS 10118]OCF26629.1 esterase [Kwoniella bestiolae CBS 10118]
MSTAQLPSANINASAQPLPVKHLLRNYTTAHPLRSPSPLPPSSRVDPSLTQRLPPATSASPLLWTLPTWWLFLRFILTKGLHVYLNLLSHFLVGPKRKSWGYRMTFITSFMRNIADHSSLADIVLIRRFISLHFLVPLPGDAVVTPITFKVPLRKGDEIARGFLREFDLNENGQRELSGEWVVGTDVWKMLKAKRRQRNRNNTRRKSSANTPSRSSMLANELRLRSNEKYSSPTTSTPVSPNKTNRSNSSTSTSTATPTTDSDTDKVAERVIYYVHGGAYYVGNAATHRLITIGVSKSCNARVFAITYRLAPEHVFPLPLHDVLNGYLRLLAPPLSIPPENIVIAGDSAGGGLSLALCMYLRDEGYKLPAGLVLMSPWVDLTMSCGSWDENAATDVVPRPEADDHLNPVGCYLGPKGIATYLTHPYASPLFGDFEGLPPMLIQSGDSEVLRDEITLLAHKATLAGVHVTHELYEDMVHVFQMFSFLPATTAAINNVGRWVCQTLPSIEEQEGRHESKLGESVEQEMETSPMVVDRDGEELGVGLPAGQTEVLPSEIDAMDDYSRSSRIRTPKQTPITNTSALKLDIGEPTTPAGPTVDTDSLPHSQGETSSRRSSGSITPTANHPKPLSDDATTSSLELHGIPFPRSTIDTFSGPHTLPRLRRSITNVPVHSPDTVPSSSPSTSRRKRGITYSSSSLHVSPAHSTGVPSNPTSPTPSIRRRLVMTHSNSGTPSTRARSKSHSDIFQLVEGYVEGGAANTTTVIDPEGEVISMGVLGEDEDPF